MKRKPKHAEADDYRYCVLPPPNNPFPVPTYEAIMVGAIVGKHKQQGWVGLVVSITGDNADVLWSHDKTPTLVPVTTLVVLDFGRNQESVRRSFGVRVEAKTEVEEQKQVATLF